MLSLFFSVSSVVLPQENTTLVKPPVFHAPVSKVSKTHLFLFLGGKVKFADPQGVAVTFLKSWDDPEKTEDDVLVTGYAVNSDQNIIVYNRIESKAIVIQLNRNQLNRIEEKNKSREEDAFP